MNPGMPGTQAFIGHVVKAMVAMHREAGVPLRTLHVGADEAPAGAWEKSPAAQATIVAHRLAGTAGLWNHFYDRVSALLKAQGVRMAGWEELGAMRVRLAGQDKLAPNPHFLGRGATLYVWNNVDGAEDLANQLANAGFEVVLAPATALYFDMAHNASPAEPGVNWAAFVDLDTVFNYTPLDSLRTAPTTHDPDPAKVRLTAAGRARVLGIEATLFSETLHTAGRLDYMLMPRMLALAERAWAADPAWARAADGADAKRLHGQAWSVFVNQLGQQVLPRLDADMPGVGYRIPPPGLLRQNGLVRFNGAWPGLVVRYTTDGSEPTAASPEATQPITASGPIRAAAFNRGGRRGASTLLDGL